MKPLARALGAVALLLCMITAHPLLAADKPDAAADRATALRGLRGTYGSPPRNADKRVNIPLLISQLKELNADTYNWLVWTQPTDWDDLKLFLPQAQKAGIKVWISLVPPSESPPKTKAYSEPFKVDYDKWAEEIGKLGGANPNLVAWSIDDFAYNFAVFTPEHTKKMIASMRAGAPKMAFVPVIYWRFLKPELSAYKGIFDAVLYPYRHDSVKMNLTEMGTIKPELAKLHQLLGPDVLGIVDIYQTKHSRAGSSTPEYVREVLAEAHAAADGVMIYTHPNPVSEKAKFDFIAAAFHEWAGTPAR